MYIKCKSSNFIEISEHINSQSASTYSAKAEHRLEELEEKSRLLPLTFALSIMLALFFAASLSHLH